MYPNGDEYDGNWEKGKQSGEGIFTEAATGKTQRGEWKDGEFIKEIKE